MEDDIADNGKKKKGSLSNSFWKAATFCGKWAFKIGFLWIGIGIGSEIFTEALSYTFAHGSDEGRFILGLIDELVNPIFEKVGITGWFENPETLHSVEQWFHSVTETVHGFLGIETPIAHVDPTATGAGAELMHGGSEMMGNDQVMPSGEMSAPVEEEYDPYLEDLSSYNTASPQNYHNMSAPCYSMAA